MEEQSHVVRLYRVVMVQVIVNDAPVAVHTARRPEDVRHALNHKRNGTRGENGVLEVDGIQRHSPSLEVGTETKLGRPGPL